MYFGRCQKTNKMKKSLNLLIKSLRNGAIKSQGNVNQVQQDTESNDNIHRGNNKEFWDFPGKKNSLHTSVQRNY